MTAIDWALVLVWLGVALSGFWKGAVRLVFGLGGLVAGLWLAVVAGGAAGNALARVVTIHWLAALLGPLLLLALAVGLALAAGWGLDRTLRALHLGWLNRMLGAGLAGALAVALLAALLATAVRLSPTFAGLAARSTIAPRLVAAFGVVVEEGEVPVDSAAD